MSYPTHFSYHGSPQTLSSLLEVTYLVCSGGSESFYSLFLSKKGSYRINGTYKVGGLYGYHLKESIVWLYKNLTKAHLLGLFQICFLSLMGWLPLLPHRTPTPESKHPCVEPHRGLPPGLAGDFHSQTRGGCIHTERAFICSCALAFNHPVFPPCCPKK